MLVDINQIRGRHTSEHWSTSFRTVVDLRQNLHSKDKVYLPISESFEGYPQGKLRIVNTRTGKELAFPDSKDFQFITWLEEK